MRNSDSKKLITSLLTATVAGFLSLSVMPEIRCKTGGCVPSKGDACMDDGQVHYNYKMVIGYDG